MLSKKINKLLVSDDEADAEKIEREFESSSAEDDYWFWPWYWFIYQWQNALQINKCASSTFFFPDKLETYNVKKCL